VIGLFIPRTSGVAGRSFLVTMREQAPCHFLTRKRGYDAGRYGEPVRLLEPTS